MDIFVDALRKTEGEIGRDLVQRDRPVVLCQREKLHKVALLVQLNDRMNAVGQNRGVVIAKKFEPILFEKLYLFSFRRNNKSKGDLFALVGLHGPFFQQIHQFFYRVIF